MKHMKKTLSLLLAALLIAVGFVPAFAVDAPGTFAVFDENGMQADAKIYAGMLAGADRVDVSEYSVPCKNSSTSFADASFNNHPEAFFVDTGTIRYGYSDNNTVTNVFLYYHTDYSAETIAATKAVVENFAASVDALGVSEIDKVLFAVNFLKERTYNGSTSNNSQNNAYDAIMTQSADKYAMARGLTYVLKALGVQAYYTEGAYNTCPFVFVFIGGKGYFVDTTINAVTANAAMISESKLISVRDDVKSSTPIKVCDWKQINGLCTTTTYDNAWWNIAGKEMSYCNGYWYFANGCDLYRSRTSTPGEKEKLTSHNAGDYSWFLPQYSMLDTVAAGDCIYFNSSYSILRYNTQTNEESVFYTLTDAEKANGKICDLEIDGNRIVYRLAKKSNVMAEPGYYTYSGSAVYLCESHVFGDWFVSEPGTCVTHVTEKRACIYCGFAETREADFYGDHVVNEWNVTKPATCLETGEKNGNCSLCGEHVDATIPLADHTLGAWTVTKEATCGAAGEEQASCTVAGCGYVATRAIPATGNHVDADKNNVCDNCGADLLQNVSGFQRIIAKIRAVIYSIILFFRNLFSR